MAPLTGSGHCPLFSHCPSPRSSLGFSSGRAARCFSFPPEWLRQASPLLFGHPSSPAFYTLSSEPAKPVQTTHKAAGLLGILYFPYIFQIAGRLGIVLSSSIRMCPPELRMRKAGIWHGPSGGLRMFAPTPPQLSQCCFPTFPVFQAKG